LTDRLTTRERYYIEGFYYCLRPATVARGIEAYEQCLRLHPEHQASRHNLGLQFMQHERFDEGIAQYEELLRRGTSNPTSYENLAGMLVMTGKFTRALEVANDFVQRYPENAAGLGMLGNILAVNGRLDEARGAIAKAEAINPLDIFNGVNKQWLAALESRWDDVQRIGEELGRSPSPFPRFQGSIGIAFSESARGRSREAKEAFERAAHVPGLSAGLRPVPRLRIALMLLRQKNYAGALGQVQLAMPDARGRDQEFLTLQLMAVAQSALGMTDDAAKTLQTLEERARALPSQREIRRVHWARGEIALLNHDTAKAVAELTKAVDMQPPRGAPIAPSWHAELWYAAALAHIAAGADAQAAPLLERLQSGHERLFGMEVWGRSFYQLGGIYERRGDQARAREQYARFVELWGDGDLEREWVLEARKRMGSR
jgi:tetratricopeptide (TPR) repeat protein